MMRSRAMRLVFYAMIVGFWTTIVFTFLHLPRLASYFYKRESINVLAAPGMFDAAYLDCFEKETGIRVYVTQFEQTEELLVKLRAAGRADYDLVMPASYVVGSLIKEGIIKKFDKAQLPFLDRLHTTLQGHYFDPKNEYTIPYAWDVYGVAINSDFFKTEPDPSWDIIFERKYGDQRIGVFESARDVVTIAALYLFGQREQLSDADIAKVYDLLVRQRPYVAVYADLRIDHFLMSGTITAAMAPASDIARAIPYDSRLRFLFPQEGTFFEIDSFALPANTRKEKQVYKLLNYVYRKEVMNQYVERFGLFSALKDTKSIHTRISSLVLNAQLLLKVRFSRDPVHPQQLVKLWVALKS